MTRSILVPKRGIDVLLMDLSMPEQSGVEVLSAIKALAPGLPVLMLRGFSGRQYARQ